MTNAQTTKLNHMHALLTLSMYLCDFLRLRPSDSTIIPLSDFMCPVHKASDAIHSSVGQITHRHCDCTNKGYSFIYLDKRHLVDDPHLNQFLHIWTVTV